MPDLALIGYSIYQLLPGQRDNPRLQRIGWLYVLSCVANIAWIFLWHYEFFELTIVAMVALLLLLIMFLLIFRSLKISIIAVIPNILASMSVLSVLGLSGVPLDMMTITIAAISIGIAVDNTIHYIHRFREEIDRDGDYYGSLHRAHNSVGYAMYYTSMIIIVGFSILILSNFWPTIYFGLFTGLAMLIALVASLTLLPQLLVWIKPFETKNHG